MASNELGQPIGVPIAVVRPDEPQRTTLVGSYCRLEPLNVAQHNEALFAAFTAADDIGDWTYLPYGPFDEAEAFTSWLSGMEGIDDPMFFAVIDAATGTAAAGLASYLRIDTYSAAIEVGHIHFSRPIQATRATTEAMYLMMRHVFDAGYRRYEWKCDDLNEPSRRAASRLGFHYEGTFRQATHYKGRNRDTAWYAILDHQWPDLRAEFERWLAPTNFDEAGNQRTALTHR